MTEIRQSCLFESARSDSCGVRVVVLGRNCCKNKTLGSCTCFTIPPCYLLDVRKFSYHECIIQSNLSAGPDVSSDA